MSKKNLNILVIGVSSNVSIGILKALRASRFVDMTLYGACVKKYAAGYAFVDHALMCPLAFDPAFPAWLSETVKLYEIDAVVSGVEEVNDILSRLKPLMDVVYLAPSHAHISIFNDKLKTALWFKENDLQHPFTLDLDNFEDVQRFDENLKFPVIVKPKNGRGSKGLGLVQDKIALKAFIEKGGFIAQELIGTPEQEYTCGVYASRFGYTEVIVMRRELVNGSTSFAEVVENDTIEKYCRAIAERLQAVCPFNVQLRLTEAGVPVCFEINMRLSGTTAMRHHFGFRDCEAWVRESVIGENAKELFCVMPGISIRCEQEVYFKKGAFETFNIGHDLAIEEIKQK